MNERTALLRPLFVVCGWRVSLITTYYRWPMRWWSLVIEDDARLQERDARILRQARTRYYDIDD